MNSLFKEPRKAELRWICEVLATGDFFKNFGSKTTLRDVPNIRDRILVMSYLLGKDETALFG